MAAKKIKPAPPEAESHLPRELPPQPGQRTGGSGSESGTDGINQVFPPEILADLAVKLVRLRMESPSSAARSRPQLASSAYDEVFADALKRAERLLLMAIGKSDEDIHAYQLFTAEDGLMSFAEIASRFSDFGWGGMKSPNTVRPIIEELVAHADTQVQRELDRMERLVGIRAGYPGGLYHLVDRVRRHVRNMITRTGLGDLFDDPKLVADEMGQVFFRLMEGGIPGDWERDLPERCATVDTYNSFIGHICGGLSSKEFLGESVIMPLDSERLWLLVFFLESALGSLDSGQAAISLMKAKPDLGKLMRMIDGRNGIPQEAVGNLANCLKEMQKTQPYGARVVKFARDAAKSLRATWERWRLVQLTAVLDLDTLRLQLRNMLGALDSSNEPVRIKVGRLLELIDLVRKYGEARSTLVPVEEMRARLGDLLELLKDKELLPEATAHQSQTNRLLRTKMDKVIKRLAEGLNPKPPGRRHVREALDKLFRETGSNVWERSCRPYEIFLFAAQNRLLPDKLVRRRSKLAAGLIPNPPYPHKALSIIASHGGSELNRLIADSGS